MAALVECGYEGPWRWAHHEWEGSFYRAWADWRPHTSPAFPRLELSGSAGGRSSEARAALWELKSTSPFATYESEQLTTSPQGLTPREYLELYCEGATPEEWVELADSFLAEMARLGH